MSPLLSLLSLWMGVAVHCSTGPLPIPGSIAVYDVTHPAVYLSQPVCDRLELLRSGARPRNMWVQRDFSEAVWVTAHEYARAHGINDQPASDCAGITYFSKLAQLLGIGRGYTRTLIGFSLAAMFRECRQEGKDAWDALSTKE